MALAMAAAEGDGLGCFQGGGRETVDLSVLVRRAAEATFAALKQLCEDCPDQSDSQRKMSLLKFISKSRQRLLRLLVLSKWCSQIRLVECCQQLLGTLSNHDISFTQAADSLFYLHEGLQQARAPLYDIASAVEVLFTGSYARLPKCIEDLCMQPVLAEEESDLIPQKLDTLLRSRLLDIPLPKGSCNITVSDGKVKFSVEGEFEAHLTLGYCRNPLLWRVLHLELLVAESTGKLKLTDAQEGTLRDELERRMAASENPLETLYSVLHDFCIVLVMDTVVRQVRTMRMGRWKDAIRFEVVSDGPSEQAGTVTGHTLVSAGDGDAELGSVRSQSSPCLKIMYWLDLHKIGDATLLPSLKIELESDNDITCSHHPPVIDPLTQIEAEFVLDQGCIDVERLLLRAICCSIHTRLLDVQRGLKSDNQLYRSESDVLLKLPVHASNRLVRVKDGTVADMFTCDIGEAGEEIICVRAYGQSYMALGINIRSGRFMLRCSCTLLPFSTLIEMEEALNQGLVSPLEVFVNLRIKSILNIFASIGTSLKLKVYEKGALALKFPADTLKLSTDALIMGFPNCESAYILSIQLDNNFIPLFTLIEGQTQSPTGQSSALTGLIQVLRFMRIDIESLLVGEDEVNISLFSEGSIEAQTEELFAGADYHKKDASICFVDSGDGKRTRAKESGNCEMDSLVEKALGAERDLYSSCQPYKHISISSPLNYQIVSPGGQFGQVYHALNISASLLENIAAGKASPNAPNLSWRFASDGNLRVVRQPSVVGLPIASRSPVISPSKKVAPGIKTFYSSEPDPFLSKSPLNLGDTVTSPINLDDDDLSKIIDSISSKTTVAPLVSSGTIDDTISLGSRFKQVGTLTPSHNSSPMQRSSAPTVNSPFPKNLSLHSNYTPQNPPLSLSPSTRTSTSGRISPAHENVNARTDSSSLLAESTEMGEILPSTSLVLTSVRTPTLLASGQHVSGCSPQQILSFEKRKGDSIKSKQIGPELLASLPSLQGFTSDMRSVKRRKLDYEASQLSSQIVHPATSYSSLLEYFRGKSYANIVAAVNQGRASISAYTAVLLYMTRRCLISIKHARLTRQMHSLGIPYIEEVGLRKSSTNLWFRLPAMSSLKESMFQDRWKDVCLCLGKSGISSWEVKIHDDHFKRLWELQKHNNVSHWGANVQFVTSEEDSHIQCTQEGLVLTYMSVQNDSIKKVLADLERLWYARTFSLGIKRLLESKMDDKAEVPLQNQGKGELGEKAWETMRKAFRIEAVGLTSVWFCYAVSLPYTIARFVVEWESGKKGCTVHVSPEQLWPHTKYLEDYINGGEVELLLDCVRVTAGPLHALVGAIRPARMTGTSAPAISLVSGVATNVASKISAGVLLTGQVLSPNSAVASPCNSGRVSVNATTVPVVGSTPAPQTGHIMPGPGRGTGLAPSSLLPTDVSVVLRSPYWIRIIYRRQFAVDMRCFAGDYVWLQPAPPPRGCTQGIKGSLPCPQFRPFVMEQITTGFNNADPAIGSSSSMLTGHANQPSTAGIVGGPSPSPAPASGTGASRPSSGSAGATRPVQGSSAQAGLANRVMNMGGIAAPGLVPANTLGTGRSVVPGVGMSLHPSYRELNAGGYGFSEDGGYGGVWVSLNVLKKVLRGTLRYLGVVWLFAQFPSIIREVLDTHLKENEGALLHHEPETPALRFYIQNCVFAVSVHRQQLVLQAINVKRYQQHQTPQLQQQQQSHASGSDSDLSLGEMQEIGDFFARRAAFEPYDASRLASFVTMLTLPVPVLREFVGLIAWKKDFNKAAQQAQLGDMSQCPRPRIELCLESRSGLSTDANVTEENGPMGCMTSGPKSSIHYDRSRSTVDFTLTLILDSANIPHVNIAGGAGWLPQCVAVGLRYVFGEGNCISLLSMEGSHGGRACWSRFEDWERCKEMVSRAVEMSGGGSMAEQSQGRLRAVAEAVQVALQSALQQLCKGFTNSPSMGVSL